MVIHIRIVERQAGRRIMDAAGSSRTLCGGAMTNRDITPADARHLGAAALEAWHVCGACLERLPRPRERRVRLPKTYLARFTRRDRTDDPKLLPVRSFRVSGWNKSEADVAAARELEAAGEDPHAWWYVGADRIR